LGSYFHGVQRGLGDILINGIGLVGRNAELIECCAKQDATHDDDRDPNHCPVFRMCYRKEVIVMTKCDVGTSQKLFEVLSISSTKGPTNRTMRS
jgi:hypothetical protein